EVTLPLVLSVLFHDIAKPACFAYDDRSERIRFDGHDQKGAEMTQNILRRLRFSNEIIDASQSAVAHHMQFKDVQQMRVATLKRMLARPGFETELALHRVDCLGSSGNLTNYDYVVAKQGEFAEEPLIPTPLINGRDLMAIGWKPGPALGEMLEQVQSQQLEGKLASGEAALAWVEKEFGSPASGEAAS
ncbi:MAG: HD domain-containing protein, partial [Verrucomicrobiota bacterium]